MNQEVRNKLNYYNEVLKYGGKSCCMPLSYRVSDRSAKYFLDTAGRGYWDQKLATFYEGEVDCDTGKPSGMGRLFVQDSDQGKVHHYVGFFDNSHIPLFY